MRTHEHPSVAIGAFLTKKGYVLCDETGRPFDGPVEARALGILTAEVFSPKCTHFLWWTFGERGVPKRHLLGVFHFSDDAPIRLEIFGRANMESLMLVAHEIEVNFKMKVCALLAKDETRFEAD